MSLLTAIFAIAVVLVLTVGFYGLIATRNLVKLLISLEILTKAVTLLLIYAGYVIGRMALAQTYVITLIIIEVIVLVVAAGIVLGAFKHNNSLDVRKLRNLKG